ncbi:hypothetical protein [Microbulbifer spongiae]|uniref:Uncharacterized protein n=1 Tax=Microbulbifer spongiae TaxID=2944933 RepID=A0ABY9E8X9_9GAMM|nr:hypothetical protein [Microbulbifer sp. MI-G]WKD48406.1 hypothetical protein M8T91_10735 [Microbulbifer sp. MI-G]
MQLTFTRKLLKLLLLSSLCLIKSCAATYNQLSSGYIPQPNEGVVLLSITEVEYPEGPEKRWFPIAGLTRSGHLDNGTLSSYDYGYNSYGTRNNNSDKSDFSSKRSTVIAVPLEPGRYAIDRFGLPLSGTWERVVKNWESLEIDVIDGQISYVGEFKVWVSETESFAGKPIPLIQKVTLANSMQTDFDFIVKDNKMLNSMKLVQSPIFLSEERQEVELWPKNF